jgi:hypothetical protein
MLYLLSLMNLEPLRVNYRGFEHRILVVEPYFSQFQGGKALFHCACQKKKLYLHEP